MLNLKNIQQGLFVVLTASTLCGCGVGNNVIFDTTPGQCPNGNNNAPYCMAVQIQNNGGGQNWINSTNFPISNVMVSVTGVGNIITPTINHTTMDPNNCTGSTINPGSNCTFYLQLSGESYGVNTQQNVQITLNYNVNNTLFGSSSTSGSSSFSIYELPNLYVMQNNGMLSMYNAAWVSNGLIESSDTANAITIDTNSYGFLYIGGNQGIYTFGANNISENQVANTSISPGTFYGANNLLTLSGNLYITNTPNTSGIWSYSLSGESWSNTSAPTYSLNVSNGVNANVSAVSPSAVIYVASGKILYSCSSTGGSNTCQPEGNSGLSSKVNSLAFVTGVGAPYTGLYAATAGGLFIESGTTPSANTSWTLVSGITAGVNVLTVANNGTLYVGDNSGNIWQISNPDSPTAVSVVEDTGIDSPIVSEVVDNYANMLYFAAGDSSTGYTVYACNLATTPCTPSSVISDLGTSQIVGMAIGSELVSGTASPGTL